MEGIDPNAASVMIGLELTGVIDHASRNGHESNHILTVKEAARSPA